MKFTGRVEIARPEEAVFAELADFSRFDQVARKRHIAMRRTDNLIAPGVGMQWQADFRFRGRMRQLQTRLSRYEPTDTLEYSGATSGFEIAVLLQLVALARGRTRLNVTFEVKPRTLGARLLLQSARLGRASLDRRFRDRLADFGRYLETRVPA